jgi:mono/diheme cytochrome c family protein
MAAGPERAEWKAPPRAARKANPVAADAASLKAGRVVYVAECLDCHGRRGTGDGKGARDLKTKVPDLNDGSVWRQSDGELFWKVSNGRGDMPGFDETLTEEKRWHVLNYCRSTFGGGGNEGAEPAAARQRREGKR